jgi:hypothetical protein
MMRQTSKHKNNTMKPPIPTPEPPQTPFKRPQYPKQHEREAIAEHAAKWRENVLEQEAESNAECERVSALEQIFAEMRDVYSKGGLHE